MAYDLVERFPLPPKYYSLYDPGTYQFEKSVFKPNTVAFLSKSPRKTGPKSVLWTQAIYDGDVPHRIPNITSLQSTLARFPYEALSAEDLERILCCCGIENTCDCPDLKNELAEVVCQGKVKRRLFKGPPQPRARCRLSRACSPPFYNTRVDESTKFYQGCKWSRRTSKRSQRVSEDGVGPAHYHLEREPTEEEICLEIEREQKRKTCKQLRYIEKVQLLNKLEGKPGPGAYSPQLPKGFSLSYLGPKAKRFPSTYSVHPGPWSHRLRRDFDPPDPPLKWCQATLPEPAGFGTKSVRSKPLKEQGPSPASYNPNFNPCLFMRCSTAPFGSSSVRFKADEIIEDSDDDKTETDVEPSKTCPTPTWEFKSKTIRIKPLVKKFNEPSPADLAQHRHKVEKSLKTQFIAPFNSSDGRFQPWNNNMPVHGKLNTPGPCYYNLEIPKSLPAFNRGPLFRAERFPGNNKHTPAPNEYNVSGGIETILHTHNTKLLKNITDQHKFVWEPPPEPIEMTLEQREQMIFKKCIAIIDADEDGQKPQRKSSKHHTLSTTVIDEKQERSKPKMLRSFLYSHPVINCF